MPLQKTVIPINFAGGVDTKSDSKTVMPTKLLALENGVFQKRNRIQKRYGYDVLSKDITGEDVPISEGAALGVYNNELHLYSGTELYTYSDGLGAWTNKGGVTSITTRGLPVLVNSYEQKNITVNHNQGLTAYAWEDSRGGTRYSVFDQVTGASILSDQVLAASSARPKVISFGDNFLIFYTKAGDTSLNYKVISVVEPESIGVEVSFTTDMNAVPNYDVVKNEDKIFVIYANDTSACTIRTMGLDFIISGATNIAEDGDGGVAAIVDQSQNVWFLYYDGADLQASVYSYTMVSVLANTVVENITATIANITGFVDGTTLTAYYEIDEALSYNHRIRQNTLTISGTAGTASNFKRSVGLSAKAFEVNGSFYIPAVHDSALQPTYFILNSTGEVVAKVTPSTSGNLVNNRTLGEVPLISTNNYLFAGGVKSSIVSENNTIFSLSGVNSTILDFNSDKKFLNAQLGDLYLVGGVVQMYDGISVVEDGFHLYPENVSTGTNTTGGLMVEGTYQVSVCYEWTDNLGQIHRSAPSIPVTQVIPAGTSTNTLTVTIPTLRLTAKTGDRTDVRLVVYGTEADGTLFYRLTSISAPTFNDVNQDTVTFTRTVADSSIISNDLLYTTGGVVENIAAPSSRLITTYKNRVFLITEDPLGYWYSKTRIQGAPVEFSDLFVGRVDAFGGDISALGALDNFVIFFKNKAVFVLSGNGPNDTATQNDFGEPQLVTTDVGCDNPNTVVVTPDGLMFKSTKGIYLLDRSLGVTYIGAAVEDYNSMTITSSQLLSDVNEVRFTTLEGVTLVYNYFFKDETGVGQWSVFTNQASEDSAIWQNGFVFLRSNGEVWVENKEVFTDDGAPIVMSLTTAWMSLAGIQGFQRIYRMMFLGEYKSPHKIEVSIGYDFSPNFEQTALIDVNQVYDITTYGEDSPYGSGSPYGGDYPLYQFKTHLTKQKCESVRFKISDNQFSLSGTYGEGFNITNIAMEVGVKPTLRKFAAKNSFATS